MNLKDKTAIVTDSTGGPLGPFLDGTIGSTISRGIDSDIYLFTISWVPSVLFASTMVISNGFSWISKLSNNASIPSDSFFTVIIMLIIITVW